MILPLSPKNIYIFPGLLISLGLAEGPQIILKQPVPAFPNISRIVTDRRPQVHLGPGVKARTCGPEKTQHKFQPSIA